MSACNPIAEAVSTAFSPTSPLLRSWTINKQVIFVDVDDTLIRSFGGKQIPMTGSVDLIRRMYENGDRLFCWSRGGDDYAKCVADSLGILECFEAFLPKPDVIIDDQGRKALEHCEIILPANAANHRR